MNTTPTPIPARGDDTTSWTTVTLTGRGHTLTLPAEPLAPGLALVPALTDSGTGWADGYCVLHTASGRHVGPRRLPLAYARELAAMLTAGDRDWTRPADLLRADPRARDHAIDVLLDLRVAQDFGVPLWWARPSRRRIPPPWLIVCTDPSADGYRYGDLAVRTWTDVVAFADHTADGRWAPIPDDATVRRAEHPECELVCAAPLCGHGTTAVPSPTVLTDWDDEHGTDQPVHTTDHAELVHHARDQGWREHHTHRPGEHPLTHEHWMCPACAADHPRTRD